MTIEQVEQVEKKTEKKSLKKYVLSGDVLHAATVSVMATDLDDAISRAEDGNYEVEDECDDNGTTCFKFDGTVVSGDEHEG